MRNFYTRLGFLKENQADKPELLAKSLSCIAENICDNEIKLAIFGEALELNPDDTVTLNSYGTALANDNQAEKAFEQFEKSLEINPDNRVTLFSLAIALEIEGDYKKALFYMEKIEIDKLPKNLAGFFCLNLGRLCYWNQQEEKGEKYFDLAIEMKADTARLNAAKELFRINNQAAREASVKLLKNIRKTAFGDAQVSLMLSLNLGLEGYFKEFNQIMEKEQHDIELLNNALYHKYSMKSAYLK